MSFAFMVTPPRVLPESVWVYRCTPVGLRQSPTK